MRTSAMRISLWLLAAAVLAAPGTLRAEPQEAPPPSRVDFGRVALAFQENKGQFDPAVLFSSRSRRATTFVTAQETVVILRQMPPLTADAAAQTLLSTGGLPTPPPAPLATATLRLSLAGASPGGLPQGIDPLPSLFHYFKGNDPARWRTGVSSYRGVKVPSVYPGVDLVLSHSDPLGLKYDFAVAPGGDVHAIRIQVAGASSVTIDGLGNLVLSSAVGDLVLPEPTVYQEVGGVRTSVSGRYLLLEGDQVGFEVGAYDPARTLIIDPYVVSSSYLGGADSDDAHGLAIDGAGFVYVAGSTQSFDFPGAGPGSPVLANGQPDGFLAKLDLVHNVIVYMTFFGGQSIDGPLAVAVDGSGNAYVTGYTFSSDFPVVSAFQATAPSGSPAFVTKFSAAGDALVYSTYLGGSAGETGEAIAVDSGGNAYVTGITSSTNFPLKNPIQSTLKGTGDAFVTKLSPSGTALVYSTYLGGSGHDYADAIAVDSAGNAVIGGTTASTNFPVLNALQGTFGGGTVDGFVTKINAAGSALVWSTFLGGRPDPTTLTAGSEGVLALALDGSGNVYATGAATPNFPILSAAQPVIGGGPTVGLQDAFAAKINGATGALVYSTYIGGTANEFGTGIAVDSAGNAVVTGSTFASDFPKVDSFHDSVLGTLDGFVTKVSAAGNSFIYSTLVGGTAFDVGNSVVIDPAGRAIVLGSTSSVDFPVRNPIQASLGGGQDLFLMRLADAPPPVVDTMVATTNADGIALSWQILLPGTAGTSVLSATVPGTSVAGTSFALTALSPGIVATLEAPTITSPLAGSTLTASSLTVTGTSSDAGLQITLVLDGAVLGMAASVPGGVWSFPLPSTLSDGIHSLVAVASDGSENFSAPSSAILFTVDTAPPAIAAPFPVDLSTTNLARPTLSARWSDVIPGVGPVVIKLDGVDVTASALVTAGGFTLVPPPLTSGVHTLFIQIADQAGLVTVYSWSFTYQPLPVDGTSPVITVSSPAEGSVTKNKKPSLTATIADAGGSGVDLSSVVFLVDGDPVPVQVQSSDPNLATATGNLASSLSDGAHLLTVTARDLAGNPAAPVSRNFIVDGSAPTISISVTPADQVQAAKTITVNFQDAGSGIQTFTRQILIDLADRSADGQFSGNTWTLAESFAIGSHSVVAQASDLAQNSGQATAAFEVKKFVPDTHFPVVRLVYPDSSSPRVPGTVMPVVVTATDNADSGDTGISSVEVLINDVPVASLPGSAAEYGRYYLFMITVPGQAGDFLGIRGRATDGASHSDVSSGMGVNVVAPKTTSPAALRLQGPSEAFIGVPETFLVTLLDPQGNAIPGGTIGAVLSSTSSPTESADTFGASSTVSLSMDFRVSGIHVLSARTGVNGGLIANSVIRVHNGVADHILVDFADNSPIVAGHALTSLRVTVQDAFNNPVPDATVTVLINLSSNGGPLAPLTVTVTTGPDGTAIIPAQQLPQNATSLTATASVTGSPGVTASTSSTVSPNVIFNLAFVHQTVEAGMPLSFTITAINPDTGAVAEEYTGTVYVYPYRQHIQGASTAANEDPTDGEVLSVTFTTADKGMKFVQDGIVLTMRGEVVLVVSTQAPSPTSTTSLEIFNAGEFTSPIATVSIQSINDPVSQVLGYSNEVVVVASKPAAFESISLDTAPIQSRVVMVDRFGNPVFLEPVKFVFNLNGADTTSLSQTDGRGQAEGYGPSNLDFGQENVIQVTASSVRYPDDVQEATASTTIPYIPNLRTIVTSDTPTVIEVGKDGQSLPGVNITISGTTTEATVTVPYHITMEGENLDNTVPHVKFHASSITGNVVDAETPAYGTGSLEGSVKNGSPMTLNRDSNGFPLPTPYTFTFSVSGITVDVPDDASIPSRHRDGRLSAFTTGGFYRTLAFFGKSLVFTGSVVQPGSDLIKDPVSQTKSAGVFLVDSEDVGHTLVTNPGLINQGVSSGNVGTFRVRAMDKNLTSTPDLHVRIQSYGTDGNLIPGGDKLVPVTMVTTSDGQTVSSVVESNPILVTDRGFLADEAVGGLPGRVSIRAQSLVPADGQTPAEVTVLVTYDDGTPVLGASVTLTKTASLGTGVATLESAPATDAAGRSMAKVTATGAGTVRISASVSAPSLDVNHPAFSVDTQSNPASVLFFSDVTVVQGQAGGRVVATLVNGSTNDDGSITASPASGFSQSKSALVLGVEIQVQPQGESEFRPAASAVFMGMTPRIRLKFIPTIEAFSLPDSTQSLPPTLFDQTFRMALVVDDGWDATSADRPSAGDKRVVDLCSSGPFQKDMTENTLTWTPADPNQLRPGANRIKVTVVAGNFDPNDSQAILDGTGPAIGLARCLAYDDGHKLLAAPFSGYLQWVPVTIPDSNKISGTITPDSNPLPLPDDPSQNVVDNTPVDGPDNAVDPFQVRARVRGRLMLEVDDTMTDVELSTLLRSQRIAPVGLLAEVHQVECLVRGDVDKACDDLQGMNKVHAAHPESALLPDQAGPTASSESYPATLGAGAGFYDGATGGFKDGAGLNKPFQGARYHFFMDTFAGSSFLDMAIAGRTAAPKPRLAILDTGLGDFPNGGAVNNQPTGDLPQGVFGRLVIANGTSELPRPALGFNDKELHDISPRGHGTIVAMMAVGAGVFHIQGTARHATLDVYKTFSGWDDTTESPAQSDAEVRIGLLQAKAYGARVINVSSGSTINPANPRDWANLREYEAILDQLSRAGVIVCMSAGNNNQNDQMHVPSGLAPARGARDTIQDEFPSDARSSLAVSVAGVHVPLDANMESHWEHTGGGVNATVSAVGDNISLPHKSLQTLRIGRGTSYASPTVAGLLAEMLFLEDTLRGGPPANDAVRKARSLYIIKILEATADDPTRARSTRFDSMDWDDDDVKRVREKADHFGFGRINPWKAFLTIANGAPSTQFREHPDGQEYRLMPTIDGGNASYLGFLLRLNVGKDAAAVNQLFQNATVWIRPDGLDPTSVSSTVIDAASNVGATTGVQGGVVHANRKTSNVNSRMPLGSAKAEGTWEGQFSAAHSRLIAPTNERLSRLELRTASSPPAAMPFFSIDLDLALLSNNADSERRQGPSNGSNVRFDDYVIEMAVNSVCQFTVAGAAANEVALPQPNTPKMLEVKILNASGVPLANQNVTFVPLSATSDIQVKGGVAAVTVKTDAAGTASVAVTRTGGTVSDILIQFQLGTEYPQSYTMPVTK